MCIIHGLWYLRPDPLYYILAHLGRSCYAFRTNAYGSGLLRVHIHCNLYVVHLGQTNWSSSLHAPKNLEQIPLRTNTEIQYRKFSLHIQYAYSNLTGSSALECARVCKKNSFFKNAWNCPIRRETVSEFEFLKFNGSWIWIFKI